MQVLKKDILTQAMVAKSNQEIKSNILLWLNRSFAIDSCKYQHLYSYKRKYLVWYLWLIMEENIFKSQILINPGFRKCGLRFYCISHIITLDIVNIGFQNSFCCFSSLPVKTRPVALIFQNKYYFVQNRYIAHIISRFIFEGRPFCFNLQGGNFLNAFYILYPEPYLENQGNHQT